MQSAGELKCLFARVAPSATRASASAQRAAASVQRAAASVQRAAASERRAACASAPWAHVLCIGVLFLRDGLEILAQRRGQEVVLRLPRARRGREPCPADEQLSPRLASARVEHVLHLPEVALLLARANLASSEGQRTPGNSLRDHTPGGPVCSCGEGGHTIDQQLSTGFLGDCVGPGAWKCVPFESDLQPAVQREGEGEGEVGIAAATCAQGNEFTPDAVPVVWRRVTVCLSPRAVPSAAAQWVAAASAPWCSLVRRFSTLDRIYWLARVGPGARATSFLLHRTQP
eukprot:5125419-Prymnesium_polylepis.1